MKQRIGVYNKKIVVAGDANLAGPNEIHISELNDASSGGSGSGSGSGSSEVSVEYLDISNLDSDVKKLNLVTISNIIKIEKDGDIMCTTPIMQLDPMSGSIGGTLDYFTNATIAVCIDFNLVIKYPDWEVTNKEFLLENGFTQEELDAIPRITKEEFYNLDNNSVPVE